MNGCPAQHPTVKDSGQQVHACGCKQEIQALREPSYTCVSVCERERQTDSLWECITWYLCVTVSASLGVAGTPCLVAWWCQTGTMRAEWHV